MSKFAVSILVIMFALCGCTKDNYEVPSCANGTFSGIKCMYYPETHIKSIDTVTIKFDQNTYTYYGTSSLDGGEGSFIQTTGKIEFRDDVARVTLYSWDWILNGTFQTGKLNNYLILVQNGNFRQISCKLQKVSQ
jgi:hypothetical protein